MKKCRKENQRKSSFSARNKKFNLNTNFYNKIHTPFFRAIIDKRKCQVINTWESNPTYFRNPTESSRIDQNYRVLVEAKKNRFSVRENYTYPTVWQSCLMYGYHDTVLIRVVLLWKSFNTPQLIHSGRVSMKLTESHWSCGFLKIKFFFISNHTNWKFRNERSFPKTHKVRELNVSKTKNVMGFGKLRCILQNFLALQENYF